MAAADDNQQKPNELLRKARKPLPPSNFEPELNEKNDQLRDKGAEALQARGTLWRAPAEVRLPSPPARWLNATALAAFVMLLVLRGRYGNI